MAWLGGCQQRAGIVKGTVVSTRGPACGLQVTSVPELPTWATALRKARSWDTTTTVVCCMLRCK